MHTLKLDINDNIFDKIMFFLNNISSDDLKIKEIDKTQQPIKNQNNIVDFFQNSPISGELDLKREEETYQDRVVF